MSNFIELGKKIYNLDNPRELHRFIVFVARCCLHPQTIGNLEKFFARSPLMEQVAQGYPYVYEQATRAFFYRGSTIEERARLIEENMTFLAERFNDDFMLKIYGDKKIELWRMPLDETLGEMNLVMCAESGQRKEGLMSVMLNLPGEVPVYQILFWIARDEIINRDKKWAMWFGAMQGPNVDDAKDLIKVITKKCHAYRTKNLILYIAQTVARIFGVEKIFAVTNEGYYANNHIRSDRKLKTSFSDFWIEVGGTATSDERFFELPLTETRKTVEEMPTRKRAVYRRRFALLDELEQSIADKLEEFKREGH
ncbi:MAG: VirK/YbjX family protein [Selenomonadaceae bacterium]|nr:VirK/YbjX family protein [Selenomonadaceae bacterium]